MKRSAGHFIIATLTFMCGLWVTCVVNNPWVMSKYHQDEFAESTLAIVGGVFCFGLFAVDVFASKRETHRFDLYTLFMVLTSFGLLYLGWFKLFGILTGGRVIYDSLMD